jgi:uncharacterized protein (DUF2147 family)
MKSILKSICCIFILAICSTQAWSEELAGLWQEYNDDTGTVEALIRIKLAADNSYEGKIEKLLPDPAGKPLALCTHCPGSLHNLPLLGLRILSGLKRRDKLNFEDGEIIDPDDGKVYRCNIRLSEDGNTIEVTGYLTFNWIGHSEVWLRTQ